jgi:hypothetical protein
VWRHRGNRHAQRAELDAASAAAAASLAEARADLEREAREAGHDTHLIESLRRIRRENHFAATVIAAFGGNPEAR